MSFSDIPTNLHPAPRTAPPSDTFQNDPLPRSDSPEALLIGALQKRVSVIADRSWYERDAEGHLQALMEVSERIVTFAAQLPAPVHPQLKHYLERCSYDKALAFLSGEPPSDIRHAH